MIESAVLNSTIIPPYCVVVQVKSRVISTIIHSCDKMSIFSQSRKKESVFRNVYQIKAILFTCIMWAMFYNLIDKKKAYQRGDKLPVSGRLMIF